MGIFKWTEHQVMKIPPEIEHRVVESADFGKVRRSIRKAIHDLFVSFPDQDQFTKEDMKEMKRGRAAYAKESQVVWKRNKMEFHHQWIKQRELKWSIAHKLATLIGMSPRFHDDGNHMDDEEHYGKNRWTKKALQREERATKYCTQN